MGKLRIIVGNIVDDEILKGHDAIVNATNPQMVMGSGISGAIFKKAGSSLTEYIDNKYKINYFNENYDKKRIMQVGEVRITPGFNLNMDIVFIQGPKKWEYANSLEMLLNTYTNLLNELIKNNYHNVLCPSLGTGAYGFSHEEVAKEVINLIKKNIKDKDLNIDFIVISEDIKKIYEQYI